MTEIKKSIGDQMADLLQEEPQRHYDVIFSVGSQKKKVGAIRFILKAASPFFRREFKENWESAGMKEDDGIPLPDVDPEAFELFVHLIISDKWSVNALNNLGLGFTTMLNLLELCRSYEITKAIKNLEEAAEPLLIQNFTMFKDTQEFLELSRKNLKTILSSDAIALDEKEVFECACRWAEHQCSQKKMELTGESFREVLGSCFFEIRFPTMTLEKFMKISIFKKNLFTAEEKVAVYEFIGLDNDEKLKYGNENNILQFETNPRYPIGCSALRLPKKIKISTNHSFRCDGKLMSNFFHVNKKISLHGIGFLGPIEGDTRYNVTVRIKRYVSGSYKHDSGTLKKQIFARKGKVFHFLFDEPMEIEPNTYHSGWNSFYKIQYSLKGANSVSQYEAASPKEESVEISGVKFTFTNEWYGHPMAELLHKTTE